MKKICIVMIGLWTVGTAWSQSCEPELSLPVGQMRDSTDHPLPELDAPRNPALRSTDEYRMVYWMSGLGSVWSQWDRAAGASDGTEPVAGFEPRKIVTSVPEIYELDASSIGPYISSHSLQVELPVNDPELPVGYDAANGIVIAHSQGGLIARSLDRQYHSTGNTLDRHFGGIVTFGTPNRGAKIIDNRYEVRQLFNKWSTEMSAGPLSQLAGYRIVFFLQDLDPPEFPDAVRTFFSKDMGAHYVGTEVPMANNIFRTDSELVADLADYESTSDLVAFYGVKERGQNIPYIKVDGFLGENFKADFWNVPVPVSWQALHYFRQDVNEEDHFTARDGEHMTAVMAHATRVSYNQHRISAKDRWATHSIVAGVAAAVGITLSGVPPLAFLSIPFYAGAGVAYENAQFWYNVEKEWRRGVEMMDKFDDMYLAAIGALTLHPLYATERICICTPETGPVITVVAPDGKSCADIEKGLPAHMMADCVEDYRQRLYGHQRRYYPSDGVILAKSAMDIPQYTYIPQEMGGSTHMGMRNDEETRNALNAIYNGDVGDFFETAKKE